MLDVLLFGFLFLFLRGTMTKQKNDLQEDIIDNLDGTTAIWNAIDNISYASESFFVSDHRRSIIPTQAHPPFFHHKKAR